MCLLTGGAHRRRVSFLSQNFFILWICHIFANITNSPLHACLYCCWADSQLHVIKSLYFWEFKTILIIHQVCEKCVKTNSQAHAQKGFVKQNTADNKISYEWTVLTHCHFGRFILCLTLMHFCSKSTEDFWMEH